MLVQKLRLSLILALREDVMLRCIAAVALALTLQINPAFASPARGMPPAGGAQAASDAFIRGRVVDPTGAPIAGARVALTPEPSGPSVAAVTDARGDFAVAVPTGTYLVTVAADGFTEAAQRLVAAGRSGQFMLQVAGVSETVKVAARARYHVPTVSSATRTPTPLRDVPQAISVASRELMADQGVASMADAVRYMPGVGFAQGEGNRDTPVLRGNSSTSDFFVDGVRDDAQYFRDIYNIERVEALKGPNALAFGRGGVGGVINRITRQAEWTARREVSAQLGSWNNRRLTADLGHDLQDTAAVRITGVFENSDSYRAGVGVERFGVNPTVAFRVGPRTVLRAGYEFFRDERTADRGMSSFNGRPLATDPSTFFGDPDASRARATVNLVSSVVEHTFGTGVTLRSRVGYGHYEKFYQNVFPGAVDATASMVSLSAYNHEMPRRNLFSQTDLIVTGRTGAIGHTILAGAEIGRQTTENFRQTGYFGPSGTTATSMLVPVSSPTVSAPVEFRQAAADVDNRSVATVAAAYAQDQVALSRHLQAVLGLRVDRFTVSLHNNRDGVDFASHDNLISPRAGLIFKPLDPVSVYGSYSLSYLPRAGDQLSSLSITNQALDPERFRNYEIGAKWDLTPSLALTSAAYQLRRDNVAVPDPIDPTKSILVDAQRTQGVEIGLNGHLTRSWGLAGGYAYQDGEITRSISSTALAGAVLAQLPRHSMSLWNKYDLTSRVGVALGLIHRGEVFTSTDNLVRLAGYTRVDAGVFVNLTAKLRAQVNVENLSNRRYYAAAHNNFNITPGSPRSLRVAVTTRF
jgi:catecholate siderophore receptor